MGDDLDHVGVGVVEAQLDSLYAVEGLREVVAELRRPEPDRIQLADPDIEPDTEAAARD